MSCLKPPRLWLCARHSAHHRTSSIRAASLTAELEAVRQEGETLKESLRRREAGRAEILRPARHRARTAEHPGDDDGLHLLPEGWVMEEGRQSQKSRRVVTDAFVLSFDDPAEDEQPPRSRKQKVITPFESITDMFSVPTPGKWTISRDGALVLADFRHDDGRRGLRCRHGACLRAVLENREAQGDFQKLVKVLLLSITTAFWGVMFGSTSA